MKRVELFLLLLVIGSLWGFFEMLALPVFALCAIGLFFIVLGRRVIDFPGSSIIIGLIVCFYKTYSDHFFICQWAGVMALAGSFDLFVSIVFKESWSKRFNPVLLGVLTNVTAFFVFVITVTFIFREPNWVSGGMERVIKYALYTAIPAAIFSGLISAPLGILAGSKLKEYYASFPLKLFPGIYLTATILLWIIAAIK